MKHIRITSTDELPWRRLNSDLISINPIASMIFPEESYFLHWLAKEHYKGVGEIIDAGPLLGGSTYALASGLEKNANVAEKSRRIHSYDLFQYFPDFKERILPGASFNQGDSLLPVFLENTKTFRDYIEVETGDISGKRWPGQPIEILFIDLAKSAQINMHVVREFFPCLIPRHSIVIHQDYFHYHCYWIHLTMQYLADYFEVIDSPSGGTLAFRCIQKIPPVVLNEMGWTDEEAEQLMDMAIEPLRGIWRLLVLTAKARLLTDIGKYESAAEVCLAVRRSSDWADSLLFDVEEAEKDIPQYYHYQAAKKLPLKDKVAGYLRHGGFLGLARALALSIRRRLVGGL